MSDQRMLERLRAITEGCRPDMHEPDEQNLKAWVVGWHLDNAMGDHIAEAAVEGGYQEYVVVMERLVGDGGSARFIRERFNLASLVALARRASWEAARV